VDGHTFPLEVANILCVCRNLDRDGIVEHVVTGTPHLPERPGAKPGLEQVVADTVPFTYFGHDRAP